MNTTKYGMLLGGLSLSMFAHGITIDFEDRSLGELVTTQYADVTFSSSTGNANFANGFGGGIILGSGSVAGGANFLEDTYIDFTSPVDNLQFDAVEPNFDGIDATFNIFHSGGMSTEFLVGLNGPGNKHVDLSAYTGVTRLEIVDILDDPQLENGIGWDNFSYEVVPEPCTMLALAAGVAGLVARRRRK